MEKKALIGAGIALSVATAAWAGGSAEQTRNVSGFDEVSLHGSMDVDITTGQEYSVRIVADENIIDEIETDIKGDTLRIRLKNGHYGRIKKMHVYVSMPELEGGSIHGSGDMTIKGGVEGDFDFSVHGSGNAVIDDVKTGDVELNIHGSGDINLEGTCGQLEASVHGSGNVHGRSFKCKTADIDIHGSGDVEIGVQDAIEASVFGSGDVDVYGKPERVRSKVRGSGDIKIH